MKNTHLFYAFSFLLLNVLMYSGAEWLVWVFLVPLIILSVRCSFRDLILSGSIAVLLAGYRWLWWLQLNTIQTLLIGLTSLYVFFMLFALLLRLFCRLDGLYFRNWFDVVTGNSKAAQLQLRSSTLVLIPPVVWFCIQKAASYTAIGSGWIDLAMFQPTMAPLIWIVGSKGITFIIVLFNSIIAAWIQEKSRSVLMSGLILLLIIGSCIAFSNFKTPNGETLKVALLQGNFFESWDWRREQADTVILDTYLTMTEEAKDEHPDIVAWPEYAIADDVLLKKPLFEKIAKEAKNTGSSIILGTLGELGGVVNGEKRVHNIAALISSNPGRFPHDSYVSVRPVPWDKAIIPGPHPRTMVTEKATVGILLCFEEMFPEIAARFSQQGAELLFSLANNSRFQQTRGLYLLTLQTRLRAAENRQYLARATNTGITQIVNPYGKIIAQAKPFSREILNSEVKLSSWVTPYARYGDRTLTVIILLMWVYLWAKKVRQEEGKGEKVKGANSFD
jgi:apolipoprotein N-acyltransferase